MRSKTLYACLFILQVAHSQCFGVPVPTPGISPYFSNYYYTSNYYYPPPMLAPPTFAPTYTNPPPRAASPPKRSVSTAPDLKCSTPTAIAYFLPAPADKVKATVISTENSVPKYNCPLCNGFADVPPNPKVPPPPPLGSPVLPGILDKIPTLSIPDDLKIMDTLSILSPKNKKPLKSDMYEKHKLPKNLRYDQELLEGFLTGLGL